MLKLLLKSKLQAMLYSMLGKNKAAKNSKGRTALFIVLYIYLAACMLFLSVTMSLSLAATLIPLGADWLYFSIFTIASLSVLFVLSIFETKAELFDCKDNDLLLSMPIPERTLVISRVSVVLLINYIVEAVLMIPAIIFYLVFSGNPIGAVGSVLLVLLIPLFATALASGFGCLLAVVSKKVRKNSFVSLALAIGFLILYFVGIDALTSGMEEILTGVDVEKLRANFKILEFIGNAALLKPLNIIAVLLVSLGFSAIVYLIISKNYFSIATDNRGAKKVKYRERRYESKNSVFALTFKELRKFFSSTTYMLNSSLGIIFLVMLSVLAIAERDSLLGFFAEMDLPDVLPVVLTGGIILASSTNMMSASALSLEGKNLWIIKSMPISDRDVLISKVLPQIIVCTPPTLLSSVLMIVASDAAPAHWAFMILTPLAANVAFAMLGLIFNIISPKFDFDNEAQPIKQSLPVFLSMMSQFLISLAALALGFILTVVGLGVAASVLLFLFFVLLSAVFAVLLLIPCKKKYSSIY